MSQTGRLALSWINKDKALISTPSGGYEWVERTDPRVTEVRRFTQVAAIGDAELSAASQNLLITGDNLHALHSLIALPEYSQHYLGKVRLAYIDPPFNTGQAFMQYDDSLEHSVWLTMFRDRISLIRNLLSPDGTLWVHLDDSEDSYARLVLDEVFGRGCYVGTVIWRSTDNSNNDAKTFSTDHNTIFIYSKNPGWLSNKVSRREDQAAHFSNPDNDPRGPWFDGNPLGSPNPRQNLKYEIVSPQGHIIKPPPNGWRWARETLESKMLSGEIRFTPDGRGIRRRTYLREQGGLPPSTLWADIDETGSNRRAKSELKRLFKGKPTSELFKTPKPEALMRKIIEIATAPGDIVLDCFAGSGTTAAVAHKLNRRWVAIEREFSTVESYTSPRLEKVILGEDPWGVTTAVGWEKGGGFRIVDLTPSMFEIKEGRIFLAEWATGDEFSDAVRAQLGFAVDQDPPFVGRKGRIRLAVIDGVVDDRIVRALVARLAEDERTVIVGKAAPDGAADLLRVLSPGSKLLKAPRDLTAPKGRIVR